MREAWGAYLAFELENGTSHEQREVIRKCVDAEPNQVHRSDFRVLESMMSNYIAVLAQATLDSSPMATQSMLVRD